MSYDIFAKRVRRWMNGTAVKRMSRSKEYDLLSGRCKVM